MTTPINYTLGSDSATTIHRVCTGMSLSAIHFTMDGPPMGGCPRIQTTTGIGTDGPTMDTVMDIIPTGTVDTIPMGTIADIRTSYTPAISDILSLAERQARQEMRDIVARVAALALEDTLVRL